MKKIAIELNNVCVSYIHNRRGIYSIKDFWLWAIAKRIWFRTMDTSISCTSWLTSLDGAFYIW